MAMRPTTQTWHKRKFPWNSVALAFCKMGLFAALAACAAAQQAQGPAGSDGRVAVPTQDPPGKEMRFAVAHQHAFSWCYGYLHVSVDKVRFEVVQPQANNNHSFDVPRSEIIAQQWIMFGQPQDAIELRVRGATYHMRWLSNESEVKMGPAKRMSPPISNPAYSVVSAIQNPTAAMAQGKAQNESVDGKGLRALGTNAGDGPATMPPAGLGMGVGTNEPAVPAGRLAGVYVATSSKDLRPSNNQYVFYADGYVVNSIPQDAMFGFDYARFNPASNRDKYMVGKYKVEGDEVKILWLNQFADPMNPEVLTMSEKSAHPAAQIGPQTFIPMCRCTGKKLSGVYRWGAPMADQYIQFFPDGRFIDHRVTDQVIVPSRFYEHPRIQGGTYSIQDQTLIFNFADGHRGTRTFLAPKVQENNPTFDWIDLGWQMLFEEGYRQRLSEKF
jgi:hypothetical protein